MVNNYKYLGITIDRRLVFGRHVTETKRKVKSRFNMINVIIKSVVNTKMFLTLCKSLIQYVMVYAAPVLLLACDSALQSLERTQIMPLRYILGLPNEASSLLVYR